MPKTINWKKGMRLSDEIFRTADTYTASHIGLAMSLASAGRFGLFPGEHTFDVSINISPDFLEVEALNCLGLTRDGNLIEVSWDSRYTSHFDTRVPLPKNVGETADYLLTIQHPGGELRQLNDSSCEPAYTLALQRADAALPGNALPISRIVHNISWQLDDIDFVPPCLFVSSHQAYMQLHARFLSLLDALEKSASAHLDSIGGDVAAQVLLNARNLKIIADKQRDTLTPMALLGIIQQCVNTFVTACELSANINLSEHDDWVNYIRAPYSEQNVRVLIESGLERCSAIVEKINSFRDAKLRVERETFPQEPAPKSKNGREVYTV